MTKIDITTTEACTKGISLFAIASKTVLPNPGHAKITSTTTTTPPTTDAEPKLSARDSKTY